MKKLLNYSEHRTFQELRHVANKEGLAVYPKVRVADVLPIDNSGIEHGLFRYALQAHFDFVVAGDDHVSLFAVEFDGPGHADEDQAQRDRKKDGLCLRFGFPILHINLNHISRRYNKKTIFAWIIEVYRMQEAFDEAQANGQVPYDEPFDPFFIICSLDDRKELFPYWISRTANLRMHQMHKEGKIRSHGSSGLICADAQGVMRGLEYINVTRDEDCS